MTYQVLTAVFLALILLAGLNIGFTYGNMYVALLLDTRDYFWPKNNPLAKQLTTEETAFTNSLEHALKTERNGIW